MADIGYRVSALTKPTSSAEARPCITDTKQLGYLARTPELSHILDMTSDQNPLSARQVKAARALLAWSQQDLAAASQVAVSTIADFERRARTPVANNAQAIRKALEAAGLEFVAAGVVSKAVRPPPPPSPHPGGLVRWVNATHLSQWGETRNGQSGMPELLSRLVFATVGPSAQIRFPSDESVQYPGWDGVCVIAEGDRYVPAGLSLWEIGAQRSRVRDKAEKDFAKRSQEPLGETPAEVTFVFVTPQRFVGKNRWAAEKKGLGFWRDVVVLDADDLVHWLETCPAVAQWLATRIGRRPAGLRNLEEAWSEWAGVSEIPLTADVVVTGRDDEQTTVLKWLREPPALLSIQAEAPDEAIAFLHAAVNPLPEAYRLSYFGRCVVADTSETARELLGLGTPLIIAMVEPDGGLAQRLVADGHHVFAAFGPHAVGSAHAHRLPRPWRFDLEEALVTARVPDEEAHRLAHASGRSLTVLRRLMPVAPHLRTPWANAAAPELIAAMFAGGWSDASPRDRRIVSDLAGRAYEDLVVVLAPLAEVGGPLVRVGEMWKVVSLQDLFTQIGGQITPDQLTRFERVFHEVLGATNPRFERHPKRKSFEEEGEFGEEPSGAIRRGLSGSMIALAVYPDRAMLIPRAEDRASTSVRKLLEGASPALWWSLSRDFQNLAEASPGAFLDALEQSLEGGAPAVAALFRSDEGVMHPVEYLSSLLWALEVLARSPQHLTRAALVLAHLDAIDPGGSWGNRPSASLRRIFLGWSPQTYATAEQRLKVLDQILRCQPAAGWKLLMRLAPRDHDHTEPSAKPRWRDFSTDEPEVITWPSVAAHATAVGERILRGVGQDVGRWCELTERWNGFNSAWRAQAAAQLEALASSPGEPKRRERLRDTLRQLVSKHRDFSDAHWAMPEADLQPLDQVIEILSPESIADRASWLFKAGNRRFSRKLSWQDHQKLIEREQTAGAVALLAELNQEQLFAFASTVTQHHALGVAIARTQLAEAAKLDLARAGLASETDGAADVGIAILFGLKLAQGTGGDAWLEAVWRRSIAEGWDESSEARIVRLLPATAATWSAVAARSKALEQVYWRTISVHGLSEETDATFVVNRLVAVGRAKDAVAFLDNDFKTPPESALLIRVLKEAATSDQELQSDDVTMFSHHVGLLFKRLDNAPDVEERQIVTLEWAYFQALQYSDRPVRTLHRALARDASFFVELIKLIYLPDKDSDVTEPLPNNMERVRSMASQAYDVLHHWTHVPGADDAGKIDGLALEGWVKGVRKQLKASGRLDVGDSKIGEILSAAAREAEQPWPPEPVRQIIEMARSRALESGFEIGVYNRRGVTVRLPHDGGEQERVLSARYSQDADALRFDWPRTAACLDRIAATYQLDATRQDLSAEQRDWL